MMLKLCLQGNRYLQHILEKKKGGPSKIQGCIKQQNQDSNFFNLALRYILLIPLLPLLIISQSTHLVLKLTTTLSYHPISPSPLKEKSLGGKKVCAFSTVFLKIPKLLLKPQFSVYFFCLFLLPHRNCCYRGLTNPIDFLSLLIHIFNTNMHVIFCFLGLTFLLAHRILFCFPAYLSQYSLSGASDSWLSLNANPQGFSRLSSCFTSFWTLTSFMYSKFEADIDAYQIYIYTSDFFPGL